MEHIAGKQRQRAEQRAFNHILKVGKNQCLAYDVDPMPELPLDNVQWGNAVYLKHFRTSYQTKFRDPKEVIQDKLSQV